MDLFTLSVYGMLTAKPAKLAHFQPVRVILFVLDRIIVPLLTFRTGHSDLYAHFVWHLQIVN